MKPNIAIIYLTAGASRRMGRSKALLPWNGKTIIAHHAEQVRAVQGAEAWIVTQPDDRALKTELDRIRWPEERRVVNPEAPHGDMLSSIQCGVRAAGTSGASTVGIALVDQPLIQRTTLEALTAAAQMRPGRILQPVCAGRRGHPVLLPQEWADELVRFSGRSLRDFLESHADLRTTVPVDDAGIYIDLDTPAVYQDHFERSGKQGALL